MDRRGPTQTEPPADGPGAALGRRAAPCRRVNAAAEMTHALRNDRDGKPEILVFSENDTDGNLEVRVRDARHPGHPPRHS